MKKINITQLLDLWLEKYHNTNMEKVLIKHPEWNSNPQEHSREFYDTYKVTQEQHDEWEIEAKALTKKITKCSKKTLERSWWSVYLNCSPSVIKDK